MVWVFENPIPLLICGGVVIALAAMGFVQSGRLVFLGGGAIVLAGTIGYAVLERFVVTPAEVVEAHVHQLAEDLLSNDSQQVLQHISHRSPQLRQLVQRHLTRFAIREARVKPNLKVDVFREQGIAKASFNGVVVVDSPRDDLRSYRHARRFLLTYRFEDGMWRLASYEESSPLGSAQSE